MKDSTRVKPSGSVHILPSKISCPCPSLLVFLRAPRTKQPRIVKQCVNLWGHSRRIRSWSWRVWSRKIWTKMAWLICPVSTRLCDAMKSKWVLMSLERSSIWFAAMMNCWLTNTGSKLTSPNSQTTFQLQPLREEVMILSLNLLFSTFLPYQMLKCQLRRQANPTVELTRTN